MLQKLFGFNATTMKMRTEVIAGATTFLTMCYILAVNPSILSTTGMDKAARLWPRPLPPFCWPLWPNCRLPKHRAWG